jgi:ferredoxin
MEDQYWFPQINRNVCISCGECVNHCPTGALGRRQDKSALVHPQLCTYCADCESLCPVGAIEIPYLVCKTETNRKSQS